MQKIGSLNAADLLGKTFRAKSSIPVYHTAGDTQPYGYFTAGKTIGILYSWLDPSPGLWDEYYWMFPDGKGGYFYVSWADNSKIDSAFFAEQGVQTTLEKIEEQKAKEENENKEWYEKLFDQAKPFIVLTIVGGLIIRAMKK